MILLAIPLLAALTTADIQELSKFENLAFQRKAEALAEARNAFAGRARDIAEHFFRHGEYPPSSTGYGFVLKALADLDATLYLIRALLDPPKYETGVTAKYGMGREPGEIQHVIETILENEQLRSDSRVTAALVEVVSVAKTKPKGLGLAAATRAVEILGKCRGQQAIEALQKFASDPEPSIRTLAVQALGRMGEVREPAQETQASTVSTLSRALQSDPDDRARLQAATSLGALGSPDSVEPLNTALKTEKNPQVVDGIVLALEKLRAPILDPALCLEILSRCWEPHACANLFSRWRASVSRETILDAAIKGPSLLRALALYSLVERPRPRTLMRPLPRQSILPPPVQGAPSGQRSVMNLPVPAPEPPPPAVFDAATQERLLSSAVEILSAEEIPFPKKGREISYGTAQMTRDALWEISGRKMEVALSYADRITPAFPSPRTSARYVASYDLHSKDSAGYLDYRRPRQLRAALALALPLALLLIPRPTRRPAIPLILAILAWGVWSLFIKGLRELPPPPLHYLTLAFIALLAAGLVTALLSFWRSRWISRGSLREMGVGALSAPVAAVLAFFVCGWSRWYGFFPIGGEGWELIFDPIGSAVVAGVAALPLSLVEILLSRWQSN